MPEKLYHASSIRGASMGRANLITEPDAPVKFRMVKLRFVDYDYDEGGAYWGMGNPIYHAWGDAEMGEQEMFVRAATRTEAKAQIVAEFRNCRFYR